jgi:predicted NBD/HSP70 family sugar kinase
MAKRDLLKALNQSSILNVIKTHGPIARADIARITLLSPAAVTLQTAELIDNGLIFEKEEGDSRGGRRPILLALNADGFHVIGAKLTENEATLALTDLNANVTARHTLILNSTQPEKVCDELAMGIDTLLATTTHSRQDVLGVGIGMAGIIDSQSGICHISPFQKWRDVPFATLLQERLDLDVCLDNDVNTLTRMELLYGAGQSVQNFLVITLGRGVGMGIVANGQVYRGARGAGAELGHTIVDPNGPTCACGNRGCLETFVAEPWLIRQTQARGAQVETPEAMVAAARAGDPDVLAVYEAAGGVFGSAVANLITLFNPALIILSGEGVRASDFIFPAMQHAIRRYTFDDLYEHVQVRVEVLSDDSWARGAASLVLERVFSTSGALARLDSERR